MNVLQLTGHFQKWNLDSYYENSIGDGFIFCAYSFPEGYFLAPEINGYSTPEILNKSYIDLQYFGKKEGGNIDKGKLKTYKFHPAAHASITDQTNIYIETLIQKGVEYQIDTLGLKNVIIPHYYENDNLDFFIGMVKTLNNWLKLNRKIGIKYFMTIPITHYTIIDENKIEKLLYNLTDKNIVFDGYYVVCESKPETGQKLNTDFKYLNNLASVLSTLKKQKFLTIYSYANWDSLIFLSITNIDFITIGTYENLRNFNINRFIKKEDGGPSKGWYFSEKLLNFVKAPLLDLVRIQNGISIIQNEKNIFSDIILEKGYPWSNQKPEVHKNYLLAIERLLRELDSEEDLSKRKNLMINKINNAINHYSQLELKGIYLTSESKNYHLESWKAFLLSRK